MRLLVLAIFVFFAVTDVGAKKIVLPSLDFPQGKSMRQEEVKQPDFEFDHHTYDFGKFSKKKKQQHIFTFTNTGNAPLVILHIATGCGCTTTSTCAGRASNSQHSSISSSPLFIMVAESTEIFCPIDQLG